MQEDKIGQSPLTNTTTRRKQTPAHTSVFGASCAFTAAISATATI
jgi:hypothetical protein